MLFTIKPSYAETAPNDCEDWVWCASPATWEDCAADSPAHAGLPETTMSAVANSAASEALPRRKTAPQRRYGELFASMNGALAMLYSAPQSEAKPIIMV
jgi:hypothetical protein